MRAALTRLEDDDRRAAEEAHAAWGWWAVPRPSKRCVRAPLPRVTPCATDATGGAVSDAVVGWHTAPLVYPAEPRAGQSIRSAKPATSTPSKALCATGS